MTAPSNTSKRKVSQIPQPESLSRINVVLVNTTLPANIGSAARAMHTMGLSHLTVVNPKHPIDDTSIAHAAGAQQVLNDCQLVNTIDEAISSSHIVFAASSRQRHIPKPVISPSQAAHIILNHPIADAQFSILFGREDRGLTNDELALADYHIQIDANPNYPVLNVASAVQVIASFIYSAAINAEHKKVDDHQKIDFPRIDVMLRQEWDVPPINHEQKDKLNSKLINLMYQLELIESIDNNNLRDLPNRLSRLSSRLQLDQKEYELLSAIIAKINLKL